MTKVRRFVSRFFARFTHSKWQCLRFFATLKMTSRAIIASLATTKRGNLKITTKFKQIPKFNPAQHPKFKQNSHSLNQPPANRISSSLKPHTTQTKPTQLQNSHNPNSTQTKLHAKALKFKQHKTHANPKQNSTAQNSHNPNSTQTTPHAKAQKKSP